jgi:hypothetical protein
MRKNCRRVFLNFLFNWIWVAFKPPKTHNNHHHTSWLKLERLWKSYWKLTIKYDISWLWTTTSWTNNKQTINEYSSYIKLMFKYEIKPWQIDPKFWISCVDIFHVNWIYSLALLLHWPKIKIENIPYIGRKDQKFMPEG